MPEIDAPPPFPRRAARAARAPLLALAALFAAGAPLPAGSVVSPLPKTAARNSLFCLGAAPPADGLAVWDRLQSPAVGITAGVVPGPMPVAVRLLIDGGARSWAWDGWRWETTVFNVDRPHDGTWTEESAELYRPVHGAIHFGYSKGQGEYGPATVFEDGAGLAGLTTLHDVAPGGLAVLGAFGLAETDAYKIKVSSDAAHATWKTSLEGLGREWAQDIFPLIPPAAQFESNDQYVVALDRHKARAFLHLSEMGAYVPMLWRDRYGNKVTFRWERKTSGLSDGVQAVIRLTIDNGAGQGASVQWAVWAGGASAVSDLARADFVGVNAPSMLIRGIPGVSGQLPPGMEYALEDCQLEVLRPGSPAFRPTEVVLSGHRADVAWGHAAWPLPDVPEGAKGAARKWTMAYNGAQADNSLLVSLKGPVGPAVEFQYEARKAPYPFGDGFTLTNDDGDTRNCVTHPIRFMGLSRAAASDGVLGTLQEWSWNEAAQKVARTDTVNGVALTEATWYDAPKPEDRANGVWRKRETLDGGAVVSAAENLATEAAGLDGGMTLVSRQSFTKKGEPAFEVATESDPESYSLRRTKATYTLPGGGVVQTVEAGHDPPNWAELNPGNQRFTKTTTGGAPGLTRRSVWDGIFLKRTYADAGPLMQGEVYGHDAANGRLASARSFLQEGSAISYGAAQTFSYDALGRAVGAETSDGAGHAYASRVTAFDTNGLPTAAVDRMGATTEAEYDDRGRPVRLSRAGVTTTYAYPTELRVEATAEAAGGRSAVETVEERDWLGRPTTASTTVRDTDSGVVLDESATRRGYSGRTIFTAVTRGRTRIARSITVDALGRPISATAPDGAVTTYAYECNSAPQGTYSIAATVRNRSAYLTTVEVRNILGQVMELRGPLEGTAVAYEYDALGNVTEAKTTVQTPAGPRSQLRAFVYDALGRLVSGTEPETGVTMYSGYNVHGLPTMVEELVGAAGPLVPFDTVDSNGSADSTGPIGSIDSIDPIDPIGSVGPVDQEETGATPPLDPPDGPRLVPMPPRWRVRTTAYDAFGRAVSVSTGMRAGSGPIVYGPDGLEYEYDASRPLLRQASRLHASETVAQIYYHDAYGRLWGERTFVSAVPAPPTRPTPINVQYTYDPWGHVGGIVYPAADPSLAGREVIYGNDPFGIAQTVSVRMGEGQEARPLAVLARDPAGGCERPHGLARACRMVWRGAEDENSTN
jgi:YD repeat-containing protein